MYKKNQILNYYYVTMRKDYAKIIRERHQKDTDFTIAGASILAIVIYLSLIIVLA